MRNGPEKVRWETFNQINYCSKEAKDAILREVVSRSAGVTSSWGADEYPQFVQISSPIFVLCNLSVHLGHSPIDSFTTF